MFFPTCCVQLRVRNDFLLVLGEDSQRMQLFVLQEMQTSSFVLNEVAFLHIMSYNLVCFLQPKTKRKSKQNIFNIPCSCLMNSLHSMPPPITLQQGQQGSDITLFQFSHPKARKATVINLVTVSIGYHLSTNTRSISTISVCTDHST